MTTSTTSIRLTLASWRKARNFTQAEMAQKLGVSLMTYTRWESKPHKITISKAFEICKILDITLNDVIFFDFDDTKCVAQ